MYNTHEKPTMLTVDWETGMKKKESGRVRGKNVDILDDEVYDELVEKAERRRMSLRVYVNKILRDKVLKDKALLHYYPNLLKAGYENGIILIRDSTLDKVAQVRLVKKSIHCDLCDSDTCIHTCFSATLPEFAYLFEDII